MYIPFSQERELLEVYEHTFYLWISPPSLEAIRNPQNYYSMKEGEGMLELEAKKEQEIKNMVSILEQIDLPDIILLTRDANTLLMRQKEAERTKAG